VATQLSPTTRGVVAVIVGMAAAGFAYGISGGLGLWSRALVTSGVAAFVTLLVIALVPRAPTR
jgi:hypothetical protein